jgi:uncharacterized membrane protein
MYYNLYQLINLKSDSRLPKKLSIRPRLLVSALLAGIVAVLLPPPVHLVARLLCSWDAFTLCFLFLTLRVMLRANPDIMRRFARQEDEGRVMILSLITIAACISVVAIGLILQDKGKENSLLFLHLGLAISTIVSSWLLVHTIFAQHYAHIYYQEERTLAECKADGLDFPGEIEPDYWDFLYFSFVIGMTGQVSDISVTSREMRRLSLIHGVLSFFFNTTIVAMMINIVAGSISPK